MNNTVLICNECGHPKDWHETRWGLKECHCGCNNDEFDETDRDDWDEEDDTEDEW